VARQKTVVRIEGGRKMGKTKAEQARNEKWDTQQKRKKVGHANDTTRYTIRYDKKNETAPHHARAPRGFFLSFSFPEEGGS